MTPEIADGAVCIDGSPAAYYYHAGSGDGVTKWFLHYQGGGYCDSLESCYGRSLTNLGSSKAYPPQLDLGGGYFSNDPTINPLMYNWNMVFFAYCDGGFYAGNNATPAVYQGTHNLYFRGFRNVQGYFKSLTANYNLLAGTEFVIGGCSAGGIATYYYIDWWREHLPKNSIVKGLPDSGFILDYEAVPGGVALKASWTWMYYNMAMASGLNQACVAAHLKDDPTLCVYAENASPFIKTPFFPLQSQYDAWQIPNILRTSNAADVNAFGKALQARFRETVMVYPQNGCFFDSCNHHCGEWDSIVIDNTRSGQAFKSWYEGGKRDYFQDQVYPCTSCC